MLSETPSEPTGEGLRAALASVPWWPLFDGPSTDPRSRKLNAWYEANRAILAALPNREDARTQVVEAERALNRLVPLLPSTARVHDDYRIIRETVRALPNREDAPEGLPLENVYGPCSCGQMVRESEVNSTSHPVGVPGHYLQMAVAAARLPIRDRRHHERRGAVREDAPSREGLDR